MNAIKRLVLPTVLLTSALSSPIYADDSSPATIQPGGGDSSNLANYLLNLGAYLGYNLTQQAPDVASPLLSATCTQLFGSASACTGGNGGSSQLPFFTAALDVLLGSIPVNPLYSQFVPSSNATYSALNAFANAAYPSYSSTSSQQGASSSVTVNSAIDQPSYQQDPVSQAVLNILGTPDYSYCMNYAGTQWTGGDSTTSTNYPDCKYLFQYQVMGNTVGTLPSTDQLISYSYNQQFLSQLNSNTLLSPLLYSTTNTSSNPGGNTPGSQNTGLTAQTQAQQAANFIRYASGAVVPTSLPVLKDYNTFYMQATNSTNNVPLATQVQAQATLAQYLARLRVFAAQSSIAYSNLYYIFSKRLPQNTNGSNSGSATSEALNEFTMATWRLYTPGGSANNNWLEQINKAPSATVQKEMVTLLAEINYQLYLSRQQQERLLLTESMMLLQNTRAGQPSPPTVSDNSTGIPSN